MNEGGCMQSVPRIVIEAAVTEIREARSALKEAKKALRAQGYSKRGMHRALRGERERHQRAWFWIEELATYQVEDAGRGATDGEA